MKKFWAEFKAFIAKGNVVDLAIAVIIGAAFNKIVSSLVNDIIMPAISILIGKVDFSDMVLKVGNASIKYGSFITSIVDFLIIAFSIFIALKYINKLNRIKEFGEEAAIKFDKKGKLKWVKIILTRFHGAKLACSLVTAVQWQKKNLLTV